MVAMNFLIIAKLVKILFRFYQIAGVFFHEKELIVNNVNKDII
jgi:hypothetical protein